MGAGVLCDGEMRRAGCVRLIFSSAPYREMPNAPQHRGREIVQETFTGKEEVGIELAQRKGHHKGAIVARGRGSIRRGMVLLRVNNADVIDEEDKAGCTGGCASASPSQSPQAAWLLAMVGLIGLRRRQG